MGFARRCAVFVLLALGAAGCDRPPDESNVREWTPQDHDHADERLRTAQQGQAQAQGAAGKGGGNDDKAVVELTWKNQCAPCHGVFGRGDGPNGPMVHAPDLTSPELQARVKDDEMIAAIKNGKNQMPRFDLSDKVVAGLVARIRASRAGGGSSSQAQAP